MAQFKKARRFLQMQQRRRERLGSEAQLEEGQRQLERAARAQADEDDAKKQLEEDIAGLCLSVCLSVCLAGWLAG